MWSTDPLLKNTVVHVVQLQGLFWADLEKPDNLYKEGMLHSKKFRIYESKETHYPLPEIDSVHLDVVFTVEQAFHHSFEWRC